MSNVQTARRYYDDCYTSLFKAVPLECRLVEPSSTTWQVYLDQTYFYPTSGGQPQDLGSIAGVPVMDVIDEGDRIAHFLGRPLEESAISNTVECRLDWPRRYDHMQQHTGQHLLSAAFVELLGLQTLSFHMGDDVSSIEIETGKLDDAQICEVERRANDLVSEARPVRISYAEAEQVSGLRKASARSGMLRVITIEAYDRSACGGTHVRTTAEIGSIQIRNSERVRRNIRLEFVCGSRALQRSRKDYQLLSRLTKIASLPPQALEEYFAGLKSRLEIAEKSAAKSAQLLAQEEGKRLYEGTPAQGDGTRRRTMTAVELTDSLRNVALAFTAQPRTVMAVLPESLPGTVLLVCSADTGLHAGSLWKTAFFEGGGKGGGSATMAQGHVTNAAALEQLLISAGIARTGAD